MSVTSLSFTFVNLYSSQAAKPVASPERSTPPAPAVPAAAAEAKHCGGERPARGPNRLVEAMMSALRELGFGAASPASPASGDAASATTSPAADGAADAAVAAQPADQGSAVATQTPAADAAQQTEGSVAATPAQPAAEPAVSLEQAVHQFAHELFSALRQIGRGESPDQGANRVEGAGGHRHHHGWRREGGDGYGDMAQRLDALAQTYAAPAVDAGASDAASASGPAVSTSISITLTVQDGQADAAAAAPSPTAETTASVAEPAAATDAAPTAVAAPAAQRNPLLDAFSKLFGALKPQAAGAAPADMADKLRTFLQTLAQAMRPEAMSSAPTPQVGGLVDVTA
jgi:hypothetical protein